MLYVCRAASLSDEGNDASDHDGLISHLRVEGNPLDKINKSKLESGVFLWGFLLKQMFINPF